jgi:histidinol-phosphate/aromatic aminotransferase/cobyric acid decarboxylase-like protein
MFVNYIQMKVVFFGMCLFATASAQICAYHGGSEIHDIDNLKQDMSVTTNTFGLLDGYFETMTRDRFAYLATHYPPSGADDVLRTAYRDFVGDTPPPIFGNGASEMIDIIIRQIPSGNWKTNDVAVQYREYSNACIKMGRKQVDHDDPSAILSVIINPNNPTGDFLEWGDMMEWVARRVRDNSYVIVDESMLFWFGSDWNKHSFLGHPEYVSQLKNERNIKIIVIQSWTKIFSSTGLRIGSAVIFDDPLRNRIMELLPPWSLNAVGRDYLLHAMNPDHRDYLERTWKYTPMWRTQIAEKISVIYPYFIIHGVGFLSWLWIDTGDAVLAEMVVRESKRIGFPIRHGKQGYGKETYIRIAVRDPELIGEWFDMLRSTRTTYLPIVNTHDIRRRLVVENRNVAVELIMKHEQHDETHADALYKYLVGYNATIQTIVVGAIPNTDKYLLVDGHHRLSAFARMGYTQIPVSVIDYFNPIIWTTRNNNLSKLEIIEKSLRGELMVSKATKHMIDMGNGNFAPIIILSEYTWTEPEN